MSNSLFDAGLRLLHPAEKPTALHGSDKDATKKRRARNRAAAKARRRNRGAR